MVPCPGPGRSCRRASLPTCLLPAETREKVSLALSPCFLHLQLPLILPLIPPGPAPSAVQEFHRLHREQVTRIMVSCYRQVCPSLQATFLETHPHPHPHRQAVAPGTALYSSHIEPDCVVIVPCPRISNAGSPLNRKEGSTQGGGMSKVKQGVSQTSRPGLLRPPEAPKYSHLYCTEM